MISTLETQTAQLRQGYYQRGTGPTEILILGSCRTMAFLSYLVRWNETGGNNQFTIRRIDPCDWIVSNRPLANLETHEGILSVLKSAKIFIHEHLENYGMFNTSRDCDNNIYRFGMHADLDISIPNFHDHWILYNDFADFGQVPEDWIERGWNEVDKFCDVCAMSSFPEMAEHFRKLWTTVRFFWRPNHTSAAFTMDIFRWMNDKFLKLPLTEDFMYMIGQEDQFRDPHTHVSQKDREAYGITWN